MSLKLGTRGSDLALVQCEKALRELGARGVEAERRIATSEGDLNTDRYIHEVEGIGVFERRIDLLVQRGDLDAGVHSMKDIPSELPGEVVIVAVIERNWPRDVLVSEEGLTLSELSRGAVVGTSSVRRRAQLLWRRSDLEVRKLRGNVDTRLEKLQEGNYEAIVLAEAGLKRLDRGGTDYSRLPCLPAANQGAIAVTAREDSEAASKLEAISEEDTALETTVERRILAEVGGGCEIPLGVLAEVEGEEISVEARIFTEDGTRACDVDMKVGKGEALEEAEKKGEELARWRAKYS